MKRKLSNGSANKVNSTVETNCDDFSCLERLLGDKYGDELDMEFAIQDATPSNLTCTNQEKNGSCKRPKTDTTKLDEENSSIPSSLPNLYDEESDFECSDEGESSSQTLGSISILTS